MIGSGNIKQYSVQITCYVDLRLCINNTAKSKLKFTVGSINCYGHDFRVNFSFNIFYFGFFNVKRYCNQTNINIEKCEAVEYLLNVIIIILINNAKCEYYIHIFLLTSMNKHYKIMLQKLFKKY